MREGGVAGGLPGGEKPGVHPRPVSSPAVDDLLDALSALRLLWLPSLVLSFAAAAGLGLIALGLIPAVLHQNAPPPRARLARVRPACPRLNPDWGRKRLAGRG